MSYTYDGDPSASDTAAVRFELGDTEIGNPLLQDEEIAWAILQETGSSAASPASIAGPDLYRSSAACMASLARRFAAQADTETGTLKVTYSKMAEQYAARAKELFSKAAGSNAPYAGGLSLAEKQANADDTDAVQPGFQRDMFDNPWAGRTGTVTRDDLGPPAS